MSHEFPRYIRFLFPLLAPIILVLCYVASEMMTKEEGRNSILVLLVISVRLLFSFVSIDIWGITTSITKKGELVLTWLLIMLGHIALYSWGNYLMKQALDRAHSINITWQTLIFPSFLLVVGFLALLYARWQTWDKEDT